MTFRAGQQARVAATGRIVTVLAASADYALVHTGFGQWTYPHTELRPVDEPDV